MARKSDRWLGAIQGRSQHEPNVRRRATRRAASSPPEVERVETFGEPAEDRGEKIVGLDSLALTTPEPRHTHRRTQFPRLFFLSARDCQRALEMRLRIRERAA